MDKKSQVEMWSDRNVSWIHSEICVVLINRTISAQKGSIKSFT